MRSLSPYFQNLQKKKVLRLYWLSDTCLKLSYSKSLTFTNLIANDTIITLEHLACLELS